MTREVKRISPEQQHCERSQRLQEQWGNFFSNIQGDVTGENCVNCGNRQGKTTEFQRREQEPLRALSGKITLGEIHCKSSKATHCRRGSVHGGHLGRANSSEMSEGMSPR